MIQIALAILLVLAIIYFVKIVRHQKRLAVKEQELNNAEMDSDILDIDKEIAKERAHQRDVEQDISDLNKGNNHE